MICTAQSPHSLHISTPSAYSMFRLWRVTVRRPKIKNPVGLEAYQWSRRSDAISGGSMISEFISRSHFAKIPGISNKNFHVLPNMFPFSGKTGWRGHSMNTYSGQVPNRSRSTGTGGSGSSEGN